MYKFINTRHISLRKGAVGEMRHILFVHVKHHTKRGVQFAIARDELNFLSLTCNLNTHVSAKYPVKMVTQS